MSNEQIVTAAALVLTLVVFAFRNKRRDKREHAKLDLLISEHVRHFRVGGYYTERELLEWLIWSNEWALAGALYKPDLHAVENSVTRLINAGTLRARFEIVDGSAVRVVRLAV